MKIFLFFLLFVFCIRASTGQTIVGKVVDSSTNELLGYVNVGVVGQSLGTITDESGAFELETYGLSAETTVRFSMIGYIAKTYTIEQLSDNNEETIEMECAPIQLSEVVVKPSKPRKIGATKKVLRGNVSGWGGVKHGKGNEIGLKMELGEFPVNVKSLHMHIFKQSFDTCLFRLHIRNIINELPGDELLTQNIYISSTKESGWIEFDLSQYQLIFKGDIILSLEWISVKGDNKNRYFSVRSNGKKMPLTPVILFSNSKNKGSSYSRWGSESQWRQSETTACFYLTVF